MDWEAQSRLLGLLSQQSSTIRRTTRRGRHGSNAKLASDSVHSEDEEKQPLGLQAAEVDLTLALRFC